MKYALLFVMLSLAFACPAFECTAFGPNVDGLNTAFFQNGDVAFGGIDHNENSIFLWDQGTWIQYSYYTQGLPVTSIAKLNPSTLMVAQGCGTYSDGVYNFDLNTHLWTLSDWFFWPKSLRKCESNQSWYVGDHIGLWKSTDGDIWTRVTDVGNGICNSFACSGSHLVTNIGSATYYSNDAGQTWQQGDIPNLQGFRYTENNTLYAYMSVGSDSDGLWSSSDYGATWGPLYYTSNMTCIGPDFAGTFALGWSQPNEWGTYLALYSPGGGIAPMNHPDLDSAVKEMDIFPLINTPSFYVINSGGFYYLTNFMTVDADDDLIPPPQAWKVSVYPNPAYSSINLKFSSGQPGRVDVSLYDLRGRNIFSEQGMSVSEGELRHALPDLPTGMYLLKIEDERYSQTEKLLILPN